MRIGILTYYKVMNFGATLQAVSTYCYLKNNGYDPVFINYQSKEAQIAIKNGNGEPQWDAQLDFVNSIIKNQTPVCETTSQLNDIIIDENIEAIIIGSDALLQHHSILARLKKGKRKPICIQRIGSDRLFPNIFWGVGFNETVPTALMSVSSQNSNYKLFFPFTKWRMRNTLSKMKYISVRDTWTRDMVLNILQRDVSITPDPVFAFEQNCSDYIPSKEEILLKYDLPPNYVCASFFEQNLSRKQFEELKIKLNKKGISFVILPMPTGRSYESIADKILKFPMSPIDWYAIIKYSKGYIGNNMHPIVVSLANAVPCYSLDNWGLTDFWGKKHDDGSSKIQHILEVFGVSGNRRIVEKGKCDISIDEIILGLENYPTEKIREKSLAYLQIYNKMMTDIIEAIR